MGAPEFLADIDESGALAIYGPLDALIASYRQEKAAVEQIAAYVGGQLGAINYFLAAAIVDKRSLSFTAPELFKVEPAIKALDASYWSKAIALTDVLDVMPAAKRNEWHEHIRNHETPPFEPETVINTLRDLIAQRERFFAERVDGLFRNLSGSHVTNSPAGFSKRMILQGITSYWGSTERVGYINDLRTVIARFMGRDEPKWHASNRIVEEARSHHGQWLSLDGGALRIRCYLNGNAHLEVHPDMAWRLNAVLASLYPAAIPAEFRRKPGKAQKAPRDFVMMGRPLPFAVLELLAGMKTGYNLIKQEDNWRQPYRREEVRNSMEFDFGSSAFESAAKHVKEEAERVLSYLGGVKTDARRWQFDYTPNEVIAEVIRHGCLPDQKAHQYYPTPDSIAQEVVALAQIGDDHDVLEPSAGTGGIADKLPIDRTTCVEISPLHAKVLEGKGFKTVCADFLQWMPGKTFDRICLNPPFADGRAQLHVERAAALLAAGGRMVAVLPASMRNKVALPGCHVAHQSEAISNEFQGTSVSVFILVAEKDPA